MPVRKRADEPRKQRATVESLLKKPVRSKEVTIQSIGDDGEEMSLTLLFKSISPRYYDSLVSQHQPTKEQAKEGATWNLETFPPALIAACSADPIISDEVAASLWDSEDWSRGELMDLFYAVAKLNNDGLDIPFTENGSATTQSSP